MQNVDLFLLYVLISTPGLLSFLNQSKVNEKLTILVDQYSKLNELASMSLSKLEVSCFQSE